MHFPTLTLPSFFSRKLSVPDYGSLGLDLHSHVLPGIDDGAADLKDSAALLKAIHELGFERTIPTPHVSEDHHPNTTPDICNAFDQINRYKTDVPANYIHSVAAEYMLDENFLKLVEEKSLLTLPGNRVLFELPFYGAPVNLEQVVFAMRTRGYTPVLAHPERYRYWIKKKDQLVKLTSMGCELQVNILSMTGYYGDRVKKAAFAIVDELDVSFLATDCHNLRQVAALRGGLNDTHLSKVLLRHTFKNRELLSGLAGV